MLSPSQPYHSAGLVLTEPAIEVLGRYVLSKVVALSRALLAYQLRGSKTPEWSGMFADCAHTYSTSVMQGLPWVCRSEGSEKHIWMQSNLSAWGPGGFWPIRIYLPSVMIMRDRNTEPSLEEILSFVAPQLVERELDGEGPFLLHSAFLYPERMKAHSREEFGIECHHFKEGSIDGWGHEFADSALIALRDEILAEEIAGKRGQLDTDFKLYIAGQRFRADRIFLRPNESESPV